MKQLLIILFVFSAFSCSKYRSATDAFSTKSTITPLFKSQTINEKLGDGGNLIKVKLTIPLTDSTLGYYDRDDVLEDENVDKLNDKEKNFIGRLVESFKYKFINLGLGLGISNRIRYSTDYEFPGIDSKYVKSIKIKKIFFSLEECEVEDVDCQEREAERPLSFEFLDKFFVNLSVIQSHDSLDFLNEPLQFLNKKEYSKFVNKAFGVRPRSFNEFSDEKGVILDEAFYDVNIARLKNTKKGRRNNNIRDNGRTFIFKVNDGNITSVKKFFEGKSFDGIVKDITLLGTNIYVELYGTQLKDLFFNKINEQVEDIYSLGIKDFKGCTADSCTNLTVNDINLVPMFEKSAHIRFDTYVLVKRLDINDFKYSGYIQLELMLDLN